NPPDYTVEAARVNPWNDPLVSHEAGVRYALETSALCGTAARVAERVAELREAGAHHVLCQMVCGYLPHARIMESMRRFGNDVIPRSRWARAGARATGAPRVSTPSLLKIFSRCLATVRGRV